LFAATPAEVSDSYDFIESALGLGVTSGRSSDIQVAPETTITNLTDPAAEKSDRISYSRPR